MAGPSNFPNGFTQGITIRGLPITIAHPGEIFWVNGSTVLAKGAVGGSNGNDGSYRRPFATIDYAIGKCTASRGDIIMVMPGHSEDIDAAAGIALDVAGVAIVGLGTGSLRPQITFSADVSTFVVSAANCSLKLVRLLRVAYSAEKAAAFAYVGHANSVRDNEQKAAIRQIEEDEWGHRREVLAILKQYDISVSKYFELKYHVIGKIISFSCHVIGWFMPFYFAGRLESGNVCEYFRMMHFFDELGITDHHQTLYEMGIKEKEHEVYFLEKLKSHPLLPFFEKVFSWGKDHTQNDVDLEAKFSMQESQKYCRKYRS